MRDGAVDKNICQSDIRSLRSLLRSEEHLSSQGVSMQLELLDETKPVAVPNKAKTSSYFNSKAPSEQSSFRPPLNESMEE